MLPPLFVNAAASKRILGLPQARRISLTQTGEEAVTVGYTDKGEPKLATLTLADYIQEFDRMRQEGSRECLAVRLRSSRYGEQFQVTGSKGDAYVVEVSDRAVACQCEDWHQHERICKHGYAALSLIGVSSLAAYRVARQPKPFVPEYRQPRRTINGIGLD